MEDIRTQALQKLEESLVGNDKKSECILIFEEAFVKLRKEMEEERQSKDSIKMELEMSTHLYERKSRIILVHVLKHWLFSGMGISALEEATEWFKKSIETYEEKKKSQSRLERVQIDGSRILSIVQNQLCAKVTSETFEEEEENKDFQKLAKILEDSIHIMISKTSIGAQKIVNINSDELIESMKEVEKFSFVLLIFLKNVQETQRNLIKEKLEIDFNEEKCKYIITHAKHHNAREVEKNVAEKVEEFFENSNITIGDVRKIIAEVNEIWQRSFYQEIGVYRNEFETMFADIEKRFKEWNIQKGPKKEENRKINEWKGPSVPIPKQVSNKEYTGTIKQTVLDISKLDNEGEYSRSIMIGGLKWRMQICVYNRGDITFFLKLEDETNQEDLSSRWQCTARYDVRIMDRSRKTFCHSEREMKHFCEESDLGSCRIPLEYLHKCREENGIDNTIHVEMDVVILASSGIPRLESSFKNPHYQKLSGVITHTFSNISTLDEDCSKSRSVKIGGSPWIVSISTFCDELKIDVECDFSNKFRLSCEAEAEIRLLKQSKSGECISKHKAEVLHTSNTYMSFIMFIPLDKLKNPKNGYIRNDSITIEAIITIFKPISS